MKFLIAVSAILAVAAAFPSENARVKRGFLDLGGHGYLGHAGNAIISGPSGVISTHGYAAPAHGYIAAAPAHGYFAAGHAGPGAIATHTETAGVINAPSATLIGPSTDGHPGAIIPKGFTALHGYAYAHGHGYHGGLWG